jgi:hypothetical protein
LIRDTASDLKGSADQGLPWYRTSEARAKMVTMPNSRAKQVLAAARGSLSRPMAFEEFLGKLVARDRANAEKRVAALEAEGSPERARLWRRLACSLMTLAPHAAKLVGKQTVQFYVADGKYRMQVFALEDLQDGNFTVYCPDVLGEAVDAGVLARPATGAVIGAAPGEANVYAVAGSGETLRVDSLDKDSLNPKEHYKDLTGWNRKALRITLPPSPSAAQVEAAETVCAMAAQHFVVGSPVVRGVPAGGAPPTAGPPRK